MKPLSGINILDLSKVLAGPLCAQILGDFGAEVVKVEPVKGGDEMRGWAPQDRNHSTMFLALNRNKRSLALDMKSAEGLEVIRRLVAQSDVVIQGFATGAAERLGIDYASLCKIKPDIIYCEISGYGRKGPLAVNPGYDALAQAFSGIISMLGAPDSPLCRATFSPVDQCTGQHAATGIMAALAERGRTGKGSYLSVSLLETAMGLMGYMAQNYWHTGALPQRMGTGHEAAAPYQTFETKDGTILLGVGNDGQWQRACAAAGWSDLATDPRFVNARERVANRNLVNDEVSRRLLSHTATEWVEMMDGAKVPCVVVQDLAQALAHPQTEASGIIIETDHSALGRIRSIGYPVQFNNQPRAAGRPAPLHGEHSAEILKDLGYSADEITALAEKNHIYQQCES